MLAVQLGSSSRTAKLLLAGCGIAATVFGWLWITQRDWLAAAFCGAALFGVVRMGSLLRRRSRLQAKSGTVAQGRTIVRALGDALWVSFAHYVVGGRMREGVVVIGPWSTVFLPIAGWSFIAWKAVQAPFVARFRFVDLAIELDDGGDVDAALRDAVVRHAGFVIDEAWSYSAAMRWLSRENAGIVWIERSPPERAVSRWRVTPPPSLERYLWIRNRVLAAAISIVVVLSVVGVIAWRASGDVDYLVATLVYAVLIGGSLVAGVLLAKRRLVIGA